MGHALDHTLMDALTRRKRMQGYEVLWLPGMDHAGIATQTRGGEAARRRRQDQGGLRPRAVHRQGVGLEARLRRHHRRADAPARRRRGLEPRPVHHGRRPVARGPHDLQAALRRRADLPGRAAGELVARAGDRDLRPRGQIRGRRGRAGVVPVRLAGRRRTAHRGRHHPGRDDARRHRDRGASRRRALPPPGRHRRCRIRSSTGEIVIVADEHVDPEFGTGAVKVTPAHDPNDFEIGLRHQLPMPSIMDTKGRITDTGTEFDGLDRFEARVKVREALAEQGRIVAEKRPYLHSVGHSERSGEAIEPRLSLQWWVKVESLAKAAGDAVRNGDTVIHPPSLEPRWFAWVDNMHDWCISRQLWWGHRIPIWHGPNGETVCVGPTRPRRRAGSRTPTCSTPGSPRRCGRSPPWAGPTTPTTWRSSIRPRVLVTGYDILFFWVARMMMFGTFVADDPAITLDGKRGPQVPFENVFLHGLIRDEFGRKMSKSRGQRHRPAGLGRAVRRRRAALHPGPRRQPRWRPVHRRGPRPRVAQLRHQAVQRHPVRAHQRGQPGPAARGRAI